MTSYIVPDFEIIKNDVSHTIPGRTFDSSTEHDVAQYIKTAITETLGESAEQAADRVTTEQTTKLEDPVQAPAESAPAADIPDARDESASKS